MNVCEQRAVPTALSIAHSPVSPNFYFDHEEGSRGCQCAGEVSIADAVEAQIEAMRSPEPCIYAAFANGPEVPEPQEDAAPVNPGGPASGSGVRRRAPLRLAGERRMEEDLAHGRARIGGGADEPEEEGRRVRAAPSPYIPSRAEREAHRATHLPYRTWCEDCVCGRHDAPPHRKVLREEERSKAEVSLDYGFLKRREEDSDEERLATLLVLKSRPSRAVRAWVVPEKGVQVESTVREVAPQSLWYQRLSPPVGSLPG